MKTQILTTALTLSLAAGAAWAEVPESVADRLGKDLTPMGAEKAGTKSGVASWSGKAIDGSAYWAVMTVVHCQTRMPQISRCIRLLHPTLANMINPDRWSKGPACDLPRHI